MEIAMLLPIAAGSALKGYWTAAAWAQLKSRGKLLGNSQRLLDSLWTILKWY
jgi:hypothetical protein